MKTKILLFAVSLAVGVIGVLEGCETSDPTFAVIENRYAPPPDGGDAALQTAVYQGWWSVTLFTTPVAAGTTSDPQRAITSTDFAYALLAPGWDPASGTTPTTLVPVKSSAALHVKRGDTLHIVVSDEATTGDCAAGKPLSQEDADFITQRIFPGLFANVTYDAATCISTPTPAVKADGGPD